MVQIIKIGVENPEELLNTAAYGSGALIRVESSSDDVTFAELGTIPLVSGTYAYTYFDQVGTGDYYRTRYSSALGLLYSDYSATFRSTDTLQALCSLYDVKQALGIDPADIADDEELLQHVGRVADTIRSKTSQDFLQDPLTGTTARLYDGLTSIDGNRLTIQGGIQSVSLLEIAIYTGGSFYTLPASVYFLRPLPYNNRPGWPYSHIQMTDYTLISTLAPVFYRGMGNIRVTGVFGWADVPAEIEGVAIRAAVNSWRMRSSGGTGDSFTTGVDGTRSYERLFSADDRRILERYSQEPRPVVA